MGNADNGRTHKEVVADVCGCDRYCILKEIVLHSGIPDRTLEQLKCIERLKYEESEKEGRDIGDEEAFNRWIRKGYAQRFSEVYKEGIRNEEIYNLVMGRSILTLNSS